LVYQNSLASGTILSGLRDGTSDFYLSNVSTNWSNLSNGICINYKYNGTPEYVGSIYVHVVPNSMVVLNLADGSPMGYVTFNNDGKGVHFQDQQRGKGQITSITAG